jgi:glycyl-tRNA synthetase beta subunit
MDTEGSVPESAKGDLLEEVTNLVESPTVIKGSFDEAFLELPAEILVMVMRKHQRYFPLYRSTDNALLSDFVTVANGVVDEGVVRSGNEAVLRARFQDAQVRIHVYSIHINMQYYIHRISHGMAATNSLLCVRVLSAYS